MMSGLTPSSPHDAIIDVEQSFRNAIKQYVLLEQAAASLAADLVTLPPQQILLRSTQLAKMQKGLAQQDEQLIAIMSLAGPEIINADFVKAYQDIIGKVILICDRIKELASLAKKDY